MTYSLAIDQIILDNFNTRSEECHNFTFNDIQRKLNRFTPVSKHTFYHFQIYAIFHKQYFMKNRQPINVLPNTYNIILIYVILPYRQ